MKDELKKSGEWKMHLIMKLKFMSDSKEKCAMYPKSNSSIVMIDNNKDEIIQELFIF